MTPTEPVSSDLPHPCVAPPAHPAPSTDAQHMVVFAIDDNDQAWYEMVIPFLVSLRATDYDGRTGVLGYGLAPWKHEHLAAQGVEVFTPVTAGRDGLAWDRYVSAAAIIGQHPTLRMLALYDADIWFPGPRFDLFSQVPDDGAIHVAPDAHFCTFVTDPLTGPRKEELMQQCMQGVIGQTGGALQAGLVAGGRAAWTAFAQHVHAQASRIGEDFQVMYGLDTTFLHLWAAQGHVRLIDCRQNFVTKWGLEERHDFTSGHVVLEYRGQPVRGLHMTGEVRFINRWRYLAREASHVLAAGQALARTAQADWQAVPAGALPAEQFARVALRLLEAREDVLAGAPRPAVTQSGRAGTVAFAAFAAHEVVLEVACAQAQLAIVVTHLSGQPSAPLVQFVHNGHVHPVTPPRTFALPVARGDHIVLRALALPGQQCHTLWDIAMRDVRQHPAGEGVSPADVPDVTS